MFGLYNGKRIPDVGCLGPLTIGLKVGQGLNVDELVETFTNYTEMNS